MIGIPLGLLYANAGEWVFHKHALHGLGKDRRSFWSFHWHEHHAKARKHDMFDDQYTGSLLKWDPQTKELAALIASGVVIAPLFPVAPFFVGTVWWSAAHYYQVHKHAHLDPRWAKANLPWHYDHHMGRDQNANWCVTYPWFDILMGTRKEYDYSGAMPVEKVDARTKTQRLLDAVKEQWARSRGARIGEAELSRKAA
jgi:sterol desaturase/sphingolipid hydroxylase (fatty acid hydroxylase superfamily)